MPRFDVVFRLQDIHCFDEADGAGEAEPYLWTVFFKLDGDSVHIATNSALAGTASVSSTSGTNRLESRETVADGNFVGNRFVLYSTPESFGTRFLDYSAG